jgi:ABC-2 type transport system permease protein
MIKLSYKQTFLQKLLGKHYKWWFIIKYNFRLAVLDFTTLIITIIRFTIPLFISLLIYSSFNETRNQLSELTLASYFFQFSIIGWGISWDLRFNIIKGGLSKILLLPSDYIFSQVFVAIGYNSFVLFLRTLLYIPIFIFQGGIIINPTFVFPTLICIFLGATMLFFYEIILGSTAFWLQVASNRVIEIFGDIIPLMAGSLILLNLNQITSFFKYLPFSITAHHPMQIYLGKYSPLETFYVIAGGIAWCIILYLLAKLIFKLGLKRNEAVGL